MGVRADYWRWLYRQEYFWFQRKAPHREFQTRIYEGLPGSGKTVFMVRDCIELMREGVIVYSNVAMRDPLTGRSARPLGGWLDMLRASVDTLRMVRDCEDRGEVAPGVVFAFDEIHLAADARAWAKTPAWWLNLMAQRRHYGIGLMGTTQNAETIEKRLRLLIGCVRRVRPMFLRRVWWRLPLFTSQDVDMALIDIPGEEALGASSISWVKAHGFHGFSTRELMASLDFADLTDDETAAEIRALTAEARTLATPADIPALYDPEWAEAPDGVVFESGVNADGEFHRPDADAHDGFSDWSGEHPETEGLVGVSAFDPD